MFKKKLLFIIVSLLYTGALLSQSSVYVSVDGDDNHSGTITEPFRTIQKGVKSVSTDGTVFIREGVYREYVEVSKSNITIAAYNNETPIIKGSDIFTGWEAVGSYWRKYTTVQPQQVFVDGNNPLQQIGMPSEHIVNDATKRYMSQVGTDINDMEPGRFWWQNDTVYIWLDDSSNPNDHAIEVSQRRRILNLLSSSNTLIKELTIEHSNCNTFAEQDAAVKLGKNNVMDNCTVQWCDFGGVSLNDNAQVINSLIIHNGATGLNASSCDNFLVKNTRMAYNNYRNFYSQWHTGGLKAATYAWGTIENCEVDNNNGPGIWFDYCHYSAHYDDDDGDNLYPIIIRNNYIHDNGTGNYNQNEINNNASILIEVSEQAYVYNNIIDNFEYRGIWISSSWFSYFVNNVVANGKVGAYSYGIDGGASYVDWAWVKYNVIANNILYNNSSSYQIRMQPDDGGTKFFGNICQNNLIYKESGTIRMIYGKDQYYSVKDWTDNTEFGANSLSEDPIFTDAMFHISANSPVIDAGYNILEDSMLVDYDNNTRIINSIIDMGVYEDQSSTGINNQTKDAIFSLSPNPTSGIIKINSSIISKNIFVKIFDTSGKLKGIEMLNNGITNTIDISNNPKGLYLVVVSSNGIEETFKIRLK